jgi:hypothetical protein
MDPLVGQGARHQLQRFDEAVAAFAQGNAEAPEVLRIGAAPDPQLDPSARQHVQRGDLLGHAQGVVQRKLHDGCAQAHAAGARRNGRQQQRRARHDRDLAVEVVLHRPDRVEAQRLAPLGLHQRLAKDLGGGLAGATGHQEVQAELHAWQGVKTRFTAVKTAAPVPFFAP